ncbi:hypothetical protein GC106_21030 [Kibdelosporangium sp. 4NS15]|uniref:Acyl-CoA dehydrogenase n=1 Tax=Kibdelosporangium persicum TaxID=2698649 RepID=A0ABX2F100_9PSEU|nr:hypothetical protein [Kibdelosporangium persicum]NRN64897.1 hypothetical protein [Kibdelosporangium persicum]
MPFPSATFAVWGSAWLHGVAAPDDALDALAVWAEMHEVVADDEGTATALELPARDERAGQLAALLAALRKAGATTARLVIPVPGDVRGLGGSTTLATAALRTSQAVVLPEAGVGIVPETVADQVIRWTVFDLPTVTPAEHTPLGEADHNLSTAMREAAGTLASLDLTSNRPGVRHEIKERVAVSARARWPIGMPQKALRVLQRAAEVAAILEVAAEDDPGGALSSSAALRRSEALRPLADAVRFARCAAVDEAVRVLSDHAGRH